MARGTRTKTAFPNYWRQLKTVMGKSVRITINSVTDSDGTPREYILRSQRSGSLVEKAAKGSVTIVLNKRDTWPSGGILIKVVGRSHEKPVKVDYSWTTGVEAEEDITIEPTLHQEIQMMA